jgi:2-oxo-4-hydroxy-4-carboxy-5-ureidoimidazoline decarboxylase
MTTIEALNALAADEFTFALGHIFEESPWIAQEAYEAGPFADRDALFAALVAVVDRTSEGDRILLITAHPDLGGRVAREGRLSAASLDEQSGAGLDRLSPDEIARFDAANGAYRQRFGFPFVICARENTKTSILDALERRTGNTRAQEVATAIAEVLKIARLRLEDLVV